MDRSDLINDGIIDGARDSASGTTVLRDAVQISLPADSVFLSVLRTTAASLAARLDFTLDDIEDLRIAVDEACALLLATAATAARLECEFELDDSMLTVRVATYTTDSAEPPRDTFAWTVLVALTGEVDSSVDPDGRVTIQLCKRTRTSA